MVRRHDRPSVRGAQVLLAALALAACSFAGSPRAASAADPLVVQTQSGAVQGIATTSGPAWRGIPYASAPIGALRWQPPQPATPWAGTRDATAFGSPCIQIDFVGGTLGSEDCLFLNVFAPVDAAPGSALPVMVHLHAGGNFVGRAVEDAHNFVSRGVLVVTLNYRLGILGFAGAPALTAEGALPEAGLLDQIAALQWVRDNIAAFGGDPANVTLFGVSAGSFDAIALSASPLAAGLFQRVAAEGDAFWATTGVGNTLADKERRGVEVAAAVGCTSPPSATCMRSASAESLVLATGDYDNGPLVGGAVQPEVALTVFRQHGSVPLLIGSNREEAAFWNPLDPLPKSEFTRSVTELMGARKTGAAVKLYPLAAYDSYRWALNTMFTDAIYTCPTRRLAVAASGHGPVYRYLYTHVLENDEFLAQFRAAHAFENIFLWDEDWYPMSPAEALLAFRMGAYWTNFAKTGDPNGPGLPVWPSYDPTLERYEVLDGDAVTSDATYHVPECGLMDTVEPFRDCNNSVCRFFTYARWWHRPE
jgi:para-nitrobenzyl esterase